MVQARKDGRWPRVVAVSDGNVDSSAASSPHPTLPSLASPVCVDAVLPRSPSNCPSMSQALPHRTQLCEVSVIILIMQKAQGATKLAQMHG